MAGVPTPETYARTPEKTRFPQKLAGENPCPGERRGRWYAGDRGQGDRHTILAQRPWPAQPRVVTAGGAGEGLAVRV